MLACAKNGVRLVRSRCAPSGPTVPPKLTYVTSSRCVATARNTLGQSVSSPRRQHLRRSSPVGQTVCCRTVDLLEDGTVKVVPEHHDHLAPASCRAANACACKVFASAPVASGCGGSQRRPASVRKCCSNHARRTFSSRSTRGGRRRSGRRARCTKHSSCRRMGERSNFAPAGVDRWSQERNEPPGLEWRAATQAATPNVYGTGIRFPQIAGKTDAGGKPPPGAVLGAGAVDHRVDGGGRGLTTTRVGRSREHRSP
jgi:hypothetical protein